MGLLSSAGCSILRSRQILRKMLSADIDAAGTGPRSPEAILQCTVVLPAAAAGVLHAGCCLLLLLLLGSCMLAG